MCGRRSVIVRYTTYRRVWSRVSRYKAAEQQFWTRIGRYKTVEPLDYVSSCVVAGQPLQGYGTALLDAGRSLQGRGTARLRHVLCGRGSAVAGQRKEALYPYVR